MKNIGYEILATNLFEDGKGYALGHNPDEPDPYVTWQFTEEDGKRDYYWGHYFKIEEAARFDFDSRTQERISDYSIRCRDDTGQVIPPRAPGLEYLDRVLLFAPQKEPKIVYVHINDFADRQKVIGGQWQGTYSHMGDAAAVITNENAQAEGKPLNRVLLNESGKEFRFYGKFLVCGKSPEQGFTSLTAEQIKTSCELFEQAARKKRSQEKPNMHPKRGKKNPNKGGNSR